MSTNSVTLNQGLNPQVPVTNPEQFNEFTQQVLSNLENGDLSRRDFDQFILQAFGHLGTQNRELQENLTLRERDLSNLTEEFTALQERLREVQNRTDVLQRENNLRNDLDIDSREYWLSLISNGGLVIGFSSFLLGAGLIVGNPVIGLPFVLGGTGLSIATGTQERSLQELRETPRERDIDHFIETHPELSREEAKERLINKLSLERRIRECFVIERFMNEPKNLQAARDKFPSRTDNALRQWMHNIYQQEEARRREPGNPSFD